MNITKTFESRNNQQCQAKDKPLHPKLMKLAQLKDSLNLKRALHWLLQGNKAPCLLAESALAADQQASTKAILLTKSAML